MHVAYKYSLLLDTLAFFLALAASLITYTCSSRMYGGHEKDTNTLIQEMMKQVMALQEKVDAIQRNLPTVGTSESNPDSNDEMEDSSGRLVQLSEATEFFGGSLFGCNIEQRLQKASWKSQNT